MIAWGVALAAVLASFVLAFVAVSYERELRAMACFLEKRECGSNERVSVDFSTRGIAGIARAINEELNAQRDARIVHRRLIVRRFVRTLPRFPTIFARRLRERRDICSCTTVQKAKRSGVDACLKPHRAWRP